MSHTPPLGYTGQRFEAQWAGAVWYALPYVLVINSDAVVTPPELEFSIAVPESVNVEIFGVCVEDLGRYTFDFRSENGWIKTPTWTLGTATRKGTTSGVQYPLVNTFPGAAPGRPSLTFSDGADGVGRPLFKGATGRQTHWTIWARRIDIKPRLL